MQNNEIADKRFNGIVAYAFNHSPRYLHQALILPPYFPLSDYLLRQSPTPVGRPAQPEAVAEPAAFVVSDRGGCLNGGEFTIDGGNIPAI